MSVVIHPCNTYETELWRLAYLAFARHLLIRIVTEALDDILCLEHVVLLFPSGDEKPLSSVLLEVWSLSCVPRPEKVQQSIWEMAGPKAKFWVCLKLSQKLNPCQNQFFDNYKTFTAQQCRNQCTYITNVAVLFAFLLSITKRLLNQLSQHYSGFPA